MSGERIETAGELDALPMGSVVVDRDGDTWMLDRHGWLSPETAGFASGTLARKWAPFTVVYRPDRDLIAEAETRGARKWLRWAADHLTDGKSYEDIAFLDPWEAVMVCSRIIRARAEQIGADRG